MKKLIILIGVVIALVAVLVIIKKVANHPSPAPTAPGILGVTWQEINGNPIITPGACLSWRCGGVSDPTLVRNSDGSLSLWFTTIGITKTNGQFSSTGPYTAKAEGHIPPQGNITISQESPVIPVGEDGNWDKYVETPTVRNINGKLYMWCLGYAKPGFAGAALGEMVTTDLTGTQWTRPAQPIYRAATGTWDSSLVSGPTVVQGPDKVWRLYYAAYGSVNGKVINGIGMLTSADALHWSPYKSNPVFINQAGAWDDEIFEPAVAYTNGQYYMWYTGWRGELKPDTPVEIGLATSPDGINWTRYPQNPVIKPGSKGSWDDFRVSSPDVLVQPDGSLLMAAHGQSHENQAAGIIGFWQSK